MQQTIHVWLEDQPGALMRVAGVITGKGANIRTLTVAPDAEQPGTARIVLSAEVEPRLRRRVINEMNRLIQVLEAVDLSDN